MAPSEISAKIRQQLRTFSRRHNCQGDHHKSEVVLTLLERQWQEMKKTQVWYAGKVLAWAVK